MKLTTAAWQRVHDDGVTMGVIQLENGSYEVLLDDGLLPTAIEDGERRTLVSAYARADQYIASQGHRCSTRCGPWKRAANDTFLI